MKKQLCLIWLLLAGLGMVSAQQIVFCPQWTAQSQFAGYYAAMEQGYYQEAGLDVRIEHPTKSYSCLERLEDGLCQVITGELLQGMVSTQQGLELVNILQTSQHSTLMLLCHQDSIDSMDKLRGKRIGTWKVGFSEIAYMLDQENDLQVEWIKFITAINLYISGAVDGIMAKSYNEVIALNMSGASVGTAISFADIGYDFPEDGLYVTADFYQQYPEACQAFAKASRKGWEWVRQNRDAAIDIVMKYAKADKVATNQHHQRWMLEEILRVQEDQEGQQPSYTLKKADFQRLEALLLKYGYLSESLDYERFIGEK